MISEQYDPRQDLSNDQSACQYGQEKFHKNPPLENELWETNGCLDRENQISLQQAPSDRLLS